MEIELIAEPTYKVRANGREICGMRVTGKWEGLRKLEDSQGRFLIVAEADGPLAASLRESMGAIFGDDDCIALHPRLTKALEDAEKFRGLLLWTLYHHQGGSSDIGQPIRRALGIGQHDRMTPEQIEAGRAAADMPANA